MAIGPLTLLKIYFLSYSLQNYANLQSILVFVTQINILMQVPLVPGRQRKKKFRGHSRSKPAAGWLEPDHLICIDTHTCTSESGCMCATADVWSIFKVQLRICKPFTCACTAILEHDSTHWNYVSKQKAPWRTCTRNDRNQAPALLPYKNMFKLKSQAS